MEIEMEIPYFMEEHCFPEKENSHAKELRRTTERSRPAQQRLLFADITSKFKPKSVKIV